MRLRCGLARKTSGRSSGRSVDRRDVHPRARRRDVAHTSARRRFAKRNRRAGRRRVHVQPLLEARARLPDRPEVLEACWIAAIAKIRARTGPAVPAFIGGRSMAAASPRASRAQGRPRARWRGRIGYPLHPNGKPSSRDEILGRRSGHRRRGNEDELSAVEMKKFLGSARTCAFIPSKARICSFGKVEHLEQAAGIISRFIARRGKGSRR